jgi:membrane protease YdiL (CAAX protease family)
MNRQISKQRMIFFISFLCVVTVIANVLAVRAGNSPAVLILIMWSPALAAIAASVLTKRSLKAIGWTPRPVKWLAIGWLLPILYAAPAYAFVWASGLGSVPNPTFLERARLTLNMPTQPNWLVIAAAFGFITIVNLPPNLILSLGEEIGWRGFLVPELAQRVGLGNAAWLSGIVWFAWHLPGFFAGAYGASGTPQIFQLACFAVLILTTGMIMAWLRMKSGSIWPAAIMHATHNGIIQVFLDRITADTGRTHYFTGEFGIALLPFTLTLAWYCWRRSQGIEGPAAEKKAALAAVDQAV